MGTKMCKQEPTVRADGGGPGKQTNLRRAPDKPLFRGQQHEIGRRFILN